MQQKQLQILIAKRIITNEIIVVFMIVFHYITLYGADNIVKRTIGDFHKIAERLDNCTDYTGPSVFFNTPVWKEFIELKNRGIKLRFITEITKDNERSFQK